MKIVIAGAGGVGFHIAKHLSEEKKDIIIIEKDAEKAKFVSDNLDCFVINGEATNIETLKEAGCGDADIFIAATDSDEVNIISCLIAASEFNIPKKIARIKKLEYGRSNMLQPKLIGINFIINPEIEAAKSIINTINFGAASDTIIFEDTDIQMRGVYIDENSSLLNKTITKIKKELKSEFIIAGIKRGRDLMIPDGYSTVSKGDYIYVVSKKQNIDEILNNIGKIRIRIKNIVIIGGGNIGRISAAGLSGKHRNVKIIEKNYEKCKYIANKLKGVTVINADASDAKIFAEENICDFDTIITATNNEELNVLSALYAKNIGVKRSIAIINKENYIEMAQKLGIDAIISPKLSTVSSVMRYIRKGNVIGLYSIFGGGAEAMEVYIGKNSQFINKPLMQIKLPKGSLVISVSRENESYIPDGNFIIKPSDKIIVFTKKDDINAIEKLL